MRLHRLVTGGAVVAVLAGTAACGLQTVEPKLELRDAAKAFGSGTSAALRLSIGSSAADIRAFGDEADKEDPGSSDTATTGSGDDSTGMTMSTTSVGGDVSGISDTDLNTLASSHIDIAFDRGANAAKTDDDSARFLVHVGDVDAAEIRSVAQVVYARVDFAGLEKQFPEMKDGVDSIRGEFTGQGSGAEAPPEALRAPATALFDGRWISLDDRKGSWLDQQTKGAQDGSGVGLADDAPAKVKQVAGKALGDNVLTVKRVGADERLGDHLVASANLRKVYAQVRGDLPGLFTGKAGDDLVKSLPAVDDVPDRTLSVSFWVRDGKLNRAELDFAQFLDKPAGHLVLRADALGDEKISAPSGAVALDPRAIADQTGTSLEDLLSGPKVDAHTIATYVDQDMVAMAQEDGAVPSVRYLPRVRQDMVDLADQSGAQITLKAVGKRVQVTVDGKSACLTPASRSDGEGTVVDGPC